MTTFFWGLEYTKVFLAYLGIMFVWPCIVFRKVLKGKPLTFSFGFCVTVQAVLVNTAVLLLGLIHMLNPWIVRILFYGTLVISLCVGIRVEEKQRKVLKRLASGTYGKKMFWGRQFLNVWKKIREFCSVLSETLRPYRLEAIAMFVLVIYGMIYFSYGAFRDFSYGCGDLYPHHEWIYGLTQGTIFSAGVYPEGMHCIVYAMHTLFGVKIYSILLFLAGIHVAVLLISAYIFLRELFVWRYTPLLVLTVFLTVDSINVNAIANFSRLQWTIPQEFALYTQLLCAAFLLRFLRGGRKRPEDLKALSEAEKTERRGRISEPEELEHSELQEEQRETEKEELSEELRRARERAKAPKLSVPEKKKKESVVLKVLFDGIFDENVFIFMMSLAASITIHFYPTIMAFFLCVAVVVPFFRKIFKLENFLALVRAVVCGVLLAVLPMGFALLSGIPFQGSIGWAMDVMKEKEPQENGGSGGSAGTGASGATAGSTGTTGTAGNAGTTGTAGNAGTTGASGGTGNTAVSAGGTGHAGKKASLPARILGGIKNAASVIYEKGFVDLYGRGRANMLLAFMNVSLLVWIFSGILWRMFPKKDAEEEEVEQEEPRDFHGYIIALIAAVFFMMLYCLKPLGLPALIERDRLGSMLQLYMSALCLVPFDFALAVAAGRIPALITKSLLIIGMAGIYLVMLFSGALHGYLFYNLTRYNASVMVTDAIVKTLPKESYTIVSTGDELYQIIDNGFHEELIHFINECMAGDFRIPTEYIFLYVEKKPIVRNQYHFLAGPEWLATEKYPELYAGFGYCQYPEILHSEISEEVVNQKYYRLPNDMKLYANISVRTSLESRLYVWCKAFEEMYPNELHTYYEDDDFVCYYFRQNPYRPYQLAIQ